MITLGSLSGASQQRWLLTVPLQIVEFFLILLTIAVVSISVFWRLLIKLLVMLIFGYLGEVGAINAWLGFTLGMGGWLWIIYEIFLGEPSKINASSGNEASQRASKLLETNQVAGSR